MKTVIELLKEHKIADNDFRASAIATGLKLWKCKSDEEKLARARLYRDWRASGIFGKATAPCFEKAMAGEAVPVEPMFTEKIKFTWVCRDCKKEYPESCEGLVSEPFAILNTVVLRCICGGVVDLCPPQKQVSE